MIYVFVELKTKKVEKWTDVFPSTFLGGNDPNILLTIPEVSKVK